MQTTHRRMVVNYVLIIINIIIRWHLYQLHFAANVQHGGRVVTKDTRAWQ